MKKNILIFLSLSLSATECDITDHLTRPLTEHALTVWSLLDLGANQTISDTTLFYDELCTASLKLCSHTRAMNESGYYPLPPAKKNELSELFTLLSAQFTSLPDTLKHDTRYIHAIDVILEYSRIFLEEDLGINA